jgi:hypothetical protein
VVVGGDVGWSREAMRAGATSIEIDRVTQMISEYLAEGAN